MIKKRKGSGGNPGLSAFFVCSVKKSEYLPFLNALLYNAADLQFQLV